MPKDFDVQEGVKLSKQYTVGKELAGGSQGAIFELQDGDGQDLPKLLKVCIAQPWQLRQSSSPLSLTRTGQDASHLLIGTPQQQIRVVRWLLCTASNSTARQGRCAGSRPAGPAAD